MRQNAINICKKYDVSIVELAFTYLYQLNDINHILVGPNNIDELSQYNDWIIPSHINMEIIEEIINEFKEFVLWIE